MITSSTSSSTLALAPAVSLEAVYRAHAEDVTRWARRMGCPPAELEDTVHDVFLTVQRLLPRFRGDSKVSTWIFAITERIVRQRRRRDRFRRLLLMARADESTPAAPVPSPIEALEQARDRDTLMATLDKLSHRLRTVFVLYEVEGRSGEEIAEMTGTRVETVWVQLHRARREFKRHMEARVACESAA